MAKNKSTNETSPGDVLEDSAARDAERIEAEERATKERLEAEAAQAEEARLRAEAEATEAERLRIEAEGRDRSPTFVVVQPFTTTRRDGQRVELKAGDSFQLGFLSDEILEVHGQAGRLKLKA